MPTIKINKPKAVYLNRSVTAKLLIPLSFLWKQLVSLVSYCVGARVGTMVFPATQIDYHSYGLLPNWQAQALQHFNSHNEISPNFHTVTTHDDAQLETLDLIHEEQRVKPIQSQKFIIYLNGNGTHFGYCINDFLLNALELKYNQIAFNFRGTNRLGKGPNSINDLITDGIAQVQRLLNLGVPSKNILLHGHSMGGAIAAKVGEHFQAHHLPLWVYNDRSFAKLSEVANWHLRGILKPERSVFHKKLGPAALMLALDITGWELDAAKAFRSIPKEYRAHVLIRTLKSNRTQRHIDDNAIPIFTSMHKALADERKPIKDALKKLRANASRDMEQEQALEIELKAMKMQTDEGIDAHSERPRTEAVKNKYGQTLHQHFSLFVMKALDQKEAIDQNSPYKSSNLS